MPKTSTNETEEGINNYDIDYIFNNTGSVDFGSSIVPTVNNAFNLGSTSFFWQVGFITSISTAQFVIPPTGPLTIRNHLLPDLDNTWDLGSAGLRFRNLYVSNLLFSQISGNTFTSTTGPLTITTPNIADPVQINRDLVPSVNNVYRVGTSALKWLAVYGTTIFSNSIDGGGTPIIFNGSLRPIYSGSFFLGSTDRVWAQGHITSLFNTTLNTRTVSGNTGGDLILTTSSAGNVISLDRHFVPSGTGLTNLGSLTNRYATVYTNSVDVPSLAVNTISSSSGNLLLTAPLTTDLITVNRDLVPSVHEANDLGISGQRWANIRGANVITNLIGNGASTLNFDSSVAPLTDLTKSIGTGANRFLEANIQTVKSTSVNADTLSTNVHQDLLLTTANPVHKITVNRDVFPTVDGTYNLGSASFKYNNLHCNVIHAPAFNVDTISTATSTDLTLTTQSASHAIVTPRNINPTVTNTQTLGTTALRWNQAYATTVFTGTVSNSGSPMLFNGSMRPSVDNTFLLGTTGLRFTQAFCRQTFADTFVETPILRAGTALDLSLTTVTPGNAIVAQRNLLPGANNTLNLGSSTVRWATVFTTTLNVTTLSLNSLSSVSGDLTLTTPLNTDRILLDRNTLPAVDNTYTLGSLANRWLAVYSPTVFVNTLDTGVGNLSVTGNILPSTDNTLTLGSSGQRFTAAHITTLNSSTVTAPTLQAPISSDLTLTTVSAGNKIVAAKNVVPNADNTLDLGASGTRFANVYANNVNATSYNANTISSVTGNLLLTAPLVGDSVTTNRAFTPTVNNSQNLGTSTLKWANIYGTTGFFGTISNNNNAIITAGGLQPNNDNQHWLGDLAKRYQRSYVMNTFTDTIASTGLNNLLLTSPSSLQKITTDRSFEPTVTDTFLLGSTLKRWANIYSNYITADIIESPANQDLYLNCYSPLHIIRCQKDLVPDQTNLFNFGSSSLLWSNSYVNNMYTNTLRGAVGSISTHNSLVPVSNNAHNLGSPSLRYSTISGSTINTQTLQNQSGTDIQCTENFIPSVNSSFSLGTSLFNWTSLFADSVIVDSIREKALGAGIVSDGSFYPLSENTSSLGTGVAKWLNGYITNMFANSISTIQNGVNLVLTTVDAAYKIIANRSFLPNANNTLNLGSIDRSWLYIFAENLYVNQITSWGLDLLLTTPSPSTFVTSSRNFVPTVDDALDLGTSSKKWRTVYASAYSGSNILTQSLAYASLDYYTGTSGVTISNTTFAKIPLNVTPTAGPYDHGNNEIKFPFLGLYHIAIPFDLDGNSGTNNWIQFKLYRSAGPFNGLYWDNVQEFAVGGASYIESNTIHFYYQVFDISERLEIHVRRTNQNITSFKFQRGAWVYLIQRTA